MNYKVLDGFVILENHSDNLFFDSSSLILFSEKKSKGIYRSISCFKEYKKQFKDSLNENPQKTVAISGDDKPNLEKISLCILTSNNCNLRCKYCYASGGAYLQDRGKMDKKIIDACIAFISKNFCFSKDIYITFFGGEPLLYPKAIQYFIERTKTVFPDIKFHYSLTTNGTIFNDSIYSLLKENKIDFQISLDGDKIHQDGLRVTKSLKGSYDTIIKNLGKFKIFTDRFAFRATITPKNLILSNIYTHFKNLGAKKMHFEILSTFKDDPLYFKIEDIENYKIQLNKLAYLYYEDFLNDETPIDITNFTRIFKSLHYGTKKNKFCGAFTNLIAINFKGEIYPCHRYVGMKNYRTGDISQKFKFPMPKELFEIEKHPSCKKCFARNLCGGGCYNNSIYSNPEELFASAHCHGYRHTALLAIWLYANLIQTAKDKFLRFFRLKDI